MASRHLGLAIVGLAALVGCVSTPSGKTTNDASPLPSSSTTPSATPFVAPSAWVLHDAVVTLAGLAGISGSTDGTGTAAKFNSPQGVAVDAS